MHIAMNTVVSITYELRDSDGNVLEASADPVSYLHGGYDGIFPRVEEELHDKHVGDNIELTLEPVDAFGDYDEELVQIEPESAFPGGKVVVDGNHPWAGERVSFKCTVTGIRPATKEEINHGHVHGAGGHHH
ncbi:FKBP-type peptidyl-prolyl cis-trans isomerase SlyD [Anaerolineae bacterium]|nr:FKBP-type peptidyl-prolyl cis-trans isomerase SlyD [Anaerolineae bacterium]